MSGFCASKLSAEAAQQLSMNQDFTVMADWDCPLSSFKGGRTAAKHVSSCHHRQLSLHCLQATSLAPRLLLLCTQKSSVAAIGGKVAEYCQHVDGLLQDEEQIGEAREGDAPARFPGCPRSKPNHIADSARLFGVSEPARPKPYGSGRIRV